jgi:hypothetical protein
MYNKVIYFFRKLFTFELFIYYMFTYNLYLNHIMFLHLFLFQIFKISLQRNFRYNEKKIRSQGVRCTGNLLYFKNSSIKINISILVLQFIYIKNYNNRSMKIKIDRVQSIVFHGPDPDHGSSIADPNP